jgi:predicted HAD superfamily phosphohydrolase YqeG
MIGDQVFTDIYGGNKLGIRTILVEPIAVKEFFGTRISRMVERFLLGHFRRTGRFDQQKPSES